MRRKTLSHLAGEGVNQHGTVPTREPHGVQGQTVGFLLVPRFTIYEFFLAVECLRLANLLHADRRPGPKIFEWKVLSPDGRPVEASNGMTVTPEASISDIGYIPTLLVLASYEPERHATKALVNWLRYLDRHGAVLGSLSTGTVLLALAGLLDGYRATAHWEALSTFREQFQRITVVDEPLVIDRTRLTCAGGVSTLNLMLHIISQRHGPGLARAVVREIYHDNMAPPAADRSAVRARQTRVYHPRITRAVREMEAHLDAPLSLAGLAGRASLSRRQFSRLFLDEVGDSPMRHYRKLRLERARQLLTQSDLSTEEVAMATGFGSLSAFSRAYRAHFGYTARDERTLYRAQRSLQFLPRINQTLIVDCRSQD